MTGRALINVGLAVVLVASFGANWYVRQPSADPNVEYAPNMARGPSFRTFEPNPNFADDMTLRPPVAGTIPRGLTPLGYGPSGAEAIRAGTELTNPFSTDDRAAAARGGVVYERYCAVCHGADGKGDGPVVEHGFRKPPTLLRTFTRQMKDGQIFHIATFGRGAMPSHASQIPVNDRWKVVLHVRLLQQRGAPPAAASAAAPVAAGLE